MSHFGGYLPIILANSSQRPPMAVLLKVDYLFTTKCQACSREYTAYPKLIYKKNVSIIITKLKDCLVRGNVLPLDSMQEFLSISFLLKVTILG